MEGENKLPGRFDRKNFPKGNFKPYLVEFFLGKNLTDCALGLYCCISEYVLKVLDNSNWYCDCLY